MLQMNPNPPQGYSWTKITLNYKCHLMLVTSSSLKNHILEKLHSSTLARYSSFQKTYAHAQRSFFWLGMKNDIYTFVSECDIFQHNKGELIRPLGTLQPLPIPTSI
jgi:hypothetical protein